MAADRVRPDDAPVLITESTTARAAAAVSSTLRRSRSARRSWFADQRLQRPARGDVDDLGRDLVPTARVISLSPYRSSVKLLPRQRDVPSVAVMVPELRTPGATSAAKPPSSLVVHPVLDRRIGPARNVDIVRPGHEIRVLDVIGGGEKARVFTTLPGPNTLPSRLMTTTRPLAVNVTMISDGRGRRSRG